MSILNVNQIQPVGSGQTITISASDITASSATITASSVTANLTGNVTGNLTGNVTSSSTSTFSSGLNVTGGSVGIGTDNPSTLLHCYGSSANTGEIKLESGSGREYILGSTGTGYGSANNFIIYDSTASAERLRIESGGDVSIGGMDANTFSNYTTLTIGGAGAVDGAGIDIERSDGTIYGRLFADTNGLQIGAPASGDYIRFETQSSERARITSTGNIQISNGNLVFSTSGTGIDFSATSDASGSTSELLDDYEEGSWTPSVTSASVTAGSYTKIGNRVIATAYIAAYGGTTFTVSTVTGLPFTINTNPNASGAGSWYQCSLTTFGGTTYYASGQCLAVENTTTIRLSATINKTASGVDGGENVIVSVVYYV